MAIDTTSIQWDDRGLVPAIVQDASTRAVLMLAYMNEEALQLTIATGQVHFWSRSRREIWRKGATSGNTMTVDSIDADCDSDAILVSVVPEGPACHTGAVSCFEGTDTLTGVDALWRTISARASDLPAGSYTADLIRAGTDATARKVVEEAGEVLIAAKNHQSGGDPERVISETADLFYHLLVLLAERGLTLELVEQELDKRAGTR
ncbi:MAG: bifunctional phosphoribosyl-AMP cyclohydrolase/phosphoribosyl-ATP diphosphatase HisIE [Actinomycetota bacterium]